MGVASPSGQKPLSLHLQVHIKPHLRENIPAQHKTPQKIEEEKTNSDTQTCENK